MSIFKKAHPLLLLLATEFQRLLAHRRICINFARCFPVDSSTLKQKTNSTTSHAVTFVSSSAHRIRIYTDRLLALLYSSALPHTIKEEFPRTNCFPLFPRQLFHRRIYTYQLLTLLHSSALPYTIQEESTLTNFLRCCSSIHNTGRIYTYQLLTLLHSSALPHTIM